MFIDTSAVVALLTNEPEAERLTQAIKQARSRHTSALVRLEACAVLATRLDISPRQAEQLFDEFLDATGIVTIAITDAIGRIAVECFETYGKGRHPARLNIVDCFSYASAKALREALLYKGEDFGMTDVNEAFK